MSPDSHMKIYFRHSYFVYMSTIICHANSLTNTIWENKFFLIYITSGKNAAKLQKRQIVKVKDANVEDAQ